MKLELRCLYYHIHECLGYCVKNIDQEVIDSMENEILSFLNGNYDIIKNKAYEKIEMHSKLMNYEAAGELKRELDYVEDVLAKQKVELRDLEDRDVINYYIHNGYVSVNIFFIRHGKLLGNKNKIFPVMDDYIEEIEDYIGLFYSKNEVPKEIIVDSSLDNKILSETLVTNVIHVSKGDKKKLLELVKTNAKISLDNEFELIKRDEKRTIGANELLRNILGLKSLYRIDIFDNSNLFVDYTVSDMVGYKDGKPSKSDYR